MHRFPDRAGLDVLDSSELPALRAKLSRSLASQKRSQLLKEYVNSLRQEAEIAPMP